MWKFPDYEVGKPIDWAKLEGKYSWLAEMQSVPQDPEWHAEGDVLTHTKMVVQALISLPEYQALDEQSQHLLFASALLHDVEKRSTTAEEMIDGKLRIVSPKHAKKGEYTARRILYCDIPTPFALREQIAKLVRLHGLPLWAIEKSNPAQAVISASLQLNTQHLAMLAKADVLGRICTDQEGILLKIALFEELCRENKCWGTEKDFATDYARFVYLSRQDSPVDYVPFDDLSFDVEVMSALPGSGKDTFIAQHFSHLPMLSLDEIRRANGIDPTDKKQGGKVIQLAKEQAKTYLRAKQPFVFNATNITKEMRGKWTQLFENYGARIRLHYVEVPYQQLLAQNHQRQYKVPESALHHLLDKLEIPFFDEAHEVYFHLDSN